MARGLRRTQNDGTAKTDDFARKSRLVQRHIASPGAAAHSFSVSQDGYVEATLLGLSAPAATTVGFGIGTLGLTGECATNYDVKTAAGPAAQIVGTGLAGYLCVTIYDVGNLTEPTLYTITVASS